MGDARSPPFDHPREPSASAGSVDRPFVACADGESDLEAHDDEKLLCTEPAGSDFSHSRLRSSVLAASSRLAAAGCAPLAPSPLPLILSYKSEKSLCGAELFCNDGGGGKLEGGPWLSSAPISSE